MKNDQFINHLMKECQENNDEITFTREHLNNCIGELARNIMTRERHNYER
jgi:thymidylate kinase